MSCLPHPVSLPHPWCSLPHPVSLPHSPRCSPAAGLQERQLPRPGDAASFDELVAVLDMIGARARLVTDPVPFLTTTRSPLDRWG